jgi:transposase
VPYDSSLSDLQWKNIKKIFKDRGYTNDNRKYLIRDVVDAIFYVVDNGIKWRAMPLDFPPWQSVYYNFRTWVASGLWEELSMQVTSDARICEGREATPSLASIDSQSQSGEPGIEGRGIDGGKKINGRKKHIAVDVNGFLLSCGVTPANEADVHMGSKLVEVLNDNEKFPRMAKILGDSAYVNAGADQKIGVTVESKERAPGQRGFVPEAFRWVVERTFAWLNRQRRLVRNYERKVENQIAMNLIGGLRICLKRIERSLRNA